MKTFNFLTFIIASIYRIETTENKINTLYFYMMIPTFD